MTSCVSRPARVLLIEDDWVAARILKYTLSKAGYEVRVVNCGGAAGEEITRYEPDAVILDLNLPNMPGSEVMRKGSSDGRAAPPGRRDPLRADVRGRSGGDSIRPTRSRRSRWRPRRSWDELAELDVPPRLFRGPAWWETIMQAGDDDAATGGRHEEAVDRLLRGTPASVGPSRSVLGCRLAAETDSGLAWLAGGDPSTADTPGEPVPIGLRDRRVGTVWCEAPGETRRSRPP